LRVCKFIVSNALNAIIYTNPASLAFITIFYIATMIIRRDTAS